RDPRPGRRASRTRLQPGARHPAADARRPRTCAGRRRPRVLGARAMTAEAVLLIAFGGPTRPEEIRPFLANVLRGRPVPPDRVEEVVHHYEAIGGRSPLNDLTFRQADGLRAQLAAAGTPLPVHVGMRNWAPYVADVLAEMAGAGVRRAVGLILAPHTTE